MQAPRSKQTTRRKPKQQRPLTNTCMEMRKELNKQKRKTLHGVSMWRYYTFLLLVGACSLSYNRYGGLLNPMLPEESEAAADTQSQQQRQPRLGDGCYHVFLDVGANIGVHGRFLYEPDKYRNSPYSVPLFDREFGSNRHGQDFCVFEFEANSKHWPRLREIAKSYSNQNWRYHVIEAAVSDFGGNTTFFHQGPGDEKFQEWGFSGAKNMGQEGGYKEIVPTIRLSQWIRHHILERDVPEGPPSGTTSNATNLNAKPILSFKMDIEGFEYVVLPDMIHERAICDFAFAFGEFHPKFVPMRQFNGRDAVAAASNNNTNSSADPKALPLHRVSLESVAEAVQYQRTLTQIIEASRHCSTRWMNVDDESYLRDGQPLPWSNGAI